MVEAKLKNVPKTGKLGFHIHEKGSCDDMGKAAGGHYNPAEAPHGLLAIDGEHKAHAGDLGNVEISKDGTGTLKGFLPSVSLRGGQYNVEGRAIILHEKEDNFGQPTGNAGDRIGCGIIQMTKDK
jgi:Cu-Zn family superoxide dismutase